MLDSDFVAALALHSHRRDVALGLNVSGRTRGLLWFYSEALKRELSDIAFKSFWYGVMQGGQTRMDEIMQLAPTADTETRKALLIEARAIRDKVEKASRILNG